jgi:hypothetical protein
MRASRRVEHDARLRWFAAVLACVLGLAVTTAARAGHPHKHVARGSVVVTAAAVDTPSGAAKSDVGADRPADARTAPVAVGPAATADSSRLASSVTAGSPPVRGPPAEGQR